MAFRLIIALLFLVLQCFPFVATADPISMVHLEIPKTTKEKGNLLSVRFNTFNTSPITCGDLFNGSKRVFCGKTSNEPNIAILGDSHAGHLYYGFANNSNVFFNKVSLLGICPPLLGTFDSTSEPDCDEQILNSIKWIQEHPSIKIVIISHFSGRLDTSNEEKINSYLNGYSKTFSALRKLGKKIIYVIDVPVLSFNPEACVERPVRLPGYENNKNCTEYPEVVRSSYDTFVKTLKNKFQDVFFYNPSKVFCNNGKCKAILDGYIQYNDTNHLSIWGSKSVVDDLIGSQPYM